MRSLYPMCKALTLWQRFWALSSVFVRGEQSLYFRRRWTQAVVHEVSQRVINYCVRWDAPDPALDFLKW